MWSWSDAMGRPWICTMRPHLHIECEDGTPTRVQQELRIDGPCVVSIGGKVVGVANGFSLGKIGIDLPPEDSPPR